MTGFVREASAQTSPQELLSDIRGFASSIEGRVPDQEDFAFLRFESGIRMFSPESGNPKKKSYHEKVFFLSLAPRNIAPVDRSLNSRNCGDPTGPG